MKTIRLLLAIVLLSMTQQGVCQEISARSEQGITFRYEILTDSTVTVVGYYDLKDNYNRPVAVEELNIPASITYKNKTYAVTEIKYCRNILVKKVVIPESVVVIRERAFSENTSLTEVIFPNTLEIIEDDAFRLCSYLQEITIPEKIDSVNCNAFSECGSLSKVTLHKGVKAIIGSFYYAFLIRDIYCYAETPPRCSEWSFENLVFEKATLHVPYGSESAYAEAEGWKEFFNITPTDIDEITIDPDEDAPVEYYNINGVKITNPAPGQLVIRKKGSKVTKIIF